MNDSFLELRLQPLDFLLNDENINEVVINPDGTVWIEARSDSYMVKVEEIKFTYKESRQIANSIVEISGNPFGEKNPIHSNTFMFNGKSIRAQCLIPPAIEHGASITLRKFTINKVDCNKITFLYGKMIDSSEIRLENAREVHKLATSGDIVKALKMCIDERLNIVISGGTSSGKTTLARTLIDMIGEQERIITIEDAFELYPSHPNLVQLEAKKVENSPRSTSILLESCLRMRPDRIIVGELRGVEAETFLQAINTGHGGSITTVHAETAKLALTRIAQLAAPKMPTMNYQDVYSYCSESIELIIQVGKKDGKRGIIEIYLPFAEAEK